MAENVMDLTLDDSSDEDKDVQVKVSAGSVRQQQDSGAVASLQQEINQVDEQLTQVEAEISRLLSKQSALRAKKTKLTQLLQAEQAAPRADWSATGFVWDSAAVDTLKKVFKLSRYRPLQREVINATLQGRDVLCLLPSGGGKSLCYQLPALIDRKHGGLAHGTQLTLVVSPLLSLIHDQMASLEALGVPAAALTSLSSKDEAAAVMARLAPVKPASSTKGKAGGSSKGSAAGSGAGASSAADNQQGLPALLYVTPERVVSSKRLMSKLEKLSEAGQLVRIAVDEAHCASAWGNDFRPDYKKLGILRTMFPKVPIIALTATATHQVQQDILNILNTPGAELFAASINRPNLYYQVELKPSTPQAASAAIVSWISSNYPAGESGIVYALTRKECETLCDELVQAGIMALHYHGDMDPVARQTAHMAWSAGDVQVVVATIAFGMGINKADVRFVVHASLSKSVENYYQESGRAGRDGLPAKCLLFYRLSDALRQAGIVCYEPSWWSHLQSMMRYGSGVGSCRRAALQAHFSEAPAECRCMCDTCMQAAGPQGNQGVGGTRQVDVYDDVMCVLKLLPGQPNGKCTLIQLLDAWKKADKQVVKKLGRDGQEQVVEAMLLKGHLQLDFGATAYATNVYLRASDRGLSYADQHATRAGSSKSYSVTLMLGEDDPSPGGAGSRVRHADSDDAEDVPGSAHVQHVIDGVRRWRQQEASRSKVFPESVMSERRLTALGRLVGSKSSARDVTLQEIKQVLGPIQGSAYGAALHQVLSQSEGGASKHELGAQDCEDVEESDVDDRPRQKKSRTAG